MPPAGLRSGPGCKRGPGYSRERSSRQKRLPAVCSTKTNAGKRLSYHPAKTSIFFRHPVRFPIFRSSAARPEKRRENGRISRPAAIFHSPAQAKRGLQNAVLLHKSQKTCIFYIGEAGLQLSHRVCMLSQNSGRQKNSGSNAAAKAAAHAGRPRNQAVKSASLTPEQAKRFRLYQGSPLFRSFFQRACSSRRSASAAPSRASETA